MDEPSRNYVVRAIRDYGLLPSDLRKAIEDMARLGAGAPNLTGMPHGFGVGDPTYAAVLRLNSPEIKGYYEDMLAVGRAIINIEGWIDGRVIGRDILKAVKIVYWDGLTDETHQSIYSRPIHKNEITERVHRASILIPASESTVYRYLRTFRAEVLRERGLRP